MAAKTFESEATAEPKTVAGKCWRWFTQKHHPTQVIAYNHGYCVGRVAHPMCVVWYGLWRVHVDSRVSV